MKFTVPETNLMCIYGTESKNSLISKLEEMKVTLQADEVELDQLTTSTLEKLYAISEEEFEEMKDEFVADFE